MVRIRRGSRPLKPHLRGLHCILRLWRIGLLGLCALEQRLVLSRVIFPLQAIASNEFTLTMGEFAPFSPCGIACKANSAIAPRRNTRQ